MKASKFRALKNKSNVLKIRTSKTRKDAISKGFRSGFEQRISTILSNAKIDFKFEPFKLNYTMKPTIKTRCLECRSDNTVWLKEYLPDFVIGNIIIEAKGEFSSKDRKKMIAVKKSNPQYSYIMLFQNGRAKIRKGSKTSNIDWALKNGFIVANVNNIVMVINLIIKG